MASDIEMYWSALLAAVTFYNNARCDLCYEHAKGLKQINTMVHAYECVCVSFKFIMTSRFVTLKRGDKNLSPI
jgi:hypothetical protein